LKILTMMLAMKLRFGPERKSQILIVMDEYQNYNSLSEVLARVKALLRRSTAVSPDQLSFGDLHLNGAERRCTYDGKELNLTVREFDLLECFLRNPRQALSRTQLIQNVWGEDYFGDDNVVDVYVRYLRRKLEEVKPDRIIQTIRGIGFALRLEE
jgi:two-component system response regulator MprA